MFFSTMDTNANSCYKTRLQGIMVVTAVYNLGLDISVYKYNYHDSLQARSIEGTGHSKNQMN